ncbi:hypothetical protein GIS00_01650 [Nakamurella sp. YIM 132087]|uniref:Uncharacterized protein n=1 Tax=Nakamurella alba TaxID=2665158 RepID=A0A7K1FGP3_9ACTN|nr:DUF6308 family protein [Nakamurella alba]MTD12649.1 hypothetical protein [Nakamurella alba]
MADEQTAVRIGGVGIDRALALDSARNYLSRRDRFAYPAYDAFASSGGPWRISDADLVAPVLLNAEMNSRVFYALEALRPHMEDWLRHIPVDARLVEAGEPELAQLGELFAVLDGGDIPLKARGAILAKVMHRKRPSFVPLYDRFIDHCYRRAPQAPVPVDMRRTWRDFLPLLGAAITRDLRDSADFFDEVAALATEPLITPLRALDIVAWYAGRTEVGAPIWRAGSPEALAEDEGDEIWIDPDDERP